MPTSTDTTMRQAQDAPERAADRHGLPQTVYRDQDSGGWWHTNALAPRLTRAEVAFTALPTRYFA